MVKEINDYGYPIRVWCCDECGEPINDDIKESGECCYHKKCWLDKMGYNESLTLENAEKYGEKMKRTVELNGFYAGMFSEAEIDEILKKEYLNGTSEEERKTDITDLAEWDEEAWLCAIND